MNRYTEAELVKIVGYLGLHIEEDGGLHRVNELTVTQAEIVADCMDRVLEGLADRLLGVLRPEACDTEDEPVMAIVR